MVQSIRELSLSGRINKLAVQVVTEQRPGYPLAIIVVIFDVEDANRLFIFRFTHKRDNSSRENVPEEICLEIRVRNHSPCLFRVRAWLIMVMLIKSRTSSIRSRVPFLADTCPSYLSLIRGHNGEGQRRLWAGSFT